MGVELRACQQSTAGAGRTVAPLLAWRHISPMPRSPKDSTPRPRASRGKSSKPPAPPREGVGGTHETRHSSKGFAESQAPFLPPTPSPRATPTSPQAPSARGEGRGEGQEHTPHDEFAAAPHPSPLPASGERG